jgi:hypothetical protein
MIVDPFQPHPTMPSNPIHPPTQSPTIIYQQSTRTPTDQLSQTSNQNQDRNTPTNAKTQNPFLPCKTKVSQKQIQEEFARIVDISELELPDLDWFKSITPKNDPYANIGKPLEEQLIGGEYLE